MESDLISRQETLDALDLMCDVICPYSKKERDIMCGACAMGSAFDVIRDQPSAQPEQRWIPCSERLPEIGKEVLLSEPNTIFIAEYHGSGDPEGLWLVEGYHHYLADVNGCAWMPLPESWKGEQ